MSKTKFLIVHGASAVVIRDGKRKVIQAGAGENFTETEIAAINGAVPRSLRKPIQEVAPEVDEDDGEDAAPAKTKGGKAKAEKPETKAQQKAREKAEQKARDEAAKESSEDDDEDADEDEDI